MPRGNLPALRLSRHQIYFLAQQRQWQRTRHEQWQGRQQSGRGELSRSKSNNERRAATTIAIPTETETKRRIEEHHGRPLQVSRPPRRRQGGAPPSLRRRRSRRWRRRKRGEPRRRQPTSRPRVPPGHLGPVRTPHPHDVLSGRGGRINSHPGNVRFRSAVDSLKCEYLDPRTKKVEKARIAAKIVSEVRT
ncbi:hypothetical protein ACHAWF_001897, partial [Thalassiosira exigua]